MNNKSSLYGAKKDCNKARISIVIATILQIMILTLACNEVQAQYDMTPGYSAGMPQEMEKLAFLEGEWKLDFYYASESDNKSPDWILIDSYSSTIESLYNGTFYVDKSIGYPLGEDGHEGFQRWEYWGIYSYDRHNRVYRISFIDNIMGLNDIYEGNFRDGTFIASNEFTRTFSRRGTDRAIQKNRFIIKDILENSFEFYWQSKDFGSSDKDKDGNVPWQWELKIIYKRI